MPGNRGGVDGPGYARFWRGVPWLFSHAVAANARENVQLLLGCPETEHGEKEKRGWTGPENDEEDPHFC